jgi:hypothetical protein
VFEVAAGGQSGRVFCAGHPLAHRQRRRVLVTGPGRIPTAAVHQARPSRTARVSRCSATVYAARQVCQVPTGIVLSYLMLWPQQSRAQDRLPGDARSHGADRLRPADRCRDLYIRPAVVACCEICCSPPGLLVSDGSSGYIQQGWVPSHAM